MWENLGDGKKRRFFLAFGVATNVVKSLDVAKFFGDADLILNVVSGKHSKHGFSKFGLL